MHEWEIFFERLSKWQPTPTPNHEGKVSGNAGNQFWELLYQAFKARMIAETSDGESNG